MSMLLPEAYVTISTFPDITLKNYTPVVKV
jgi:hypothetical protein